MTQDELAVLVALREGDLDPLSEILALEGDLHPLIQRELNIMITGWAKRDFRLTVASRLHHKKTGKAQRAQRAKEVALTSRALDLGAAERGKRDGAVLQAAIEMEINPETALVYFKKRRKSVTMLRHHTRLGRQEER